MTAAETAAKVAADIRAQGHYQGDGPVHDGSTPGPCCVMANPTMRRATLNERAAFGIAFRTATDTPLGGISAWNDTHTTAEVLAVLDRIAGTP